MKLAVVFGGTSTEHDVSVVSGTSVLKNLNKDKYEILPLFIDKNGEWYKYTKEVRKIEHKIKMDVAKSNEQNLANEISDVYILLMSLCVIGNIDLFEAFKEKEKINLKREWK